MRDFANLFKALSDETRIRILKVLLERECCVCEVMQALDITQSRASRNLGMLEDAGFVKSRRDGLWIVYSIDEQRMNSHAAPLIELLKGGLATLQDYLLVHLPFVVPAFFLAGALYALFPKDKILRYLGPNSPKYISYPMSVAAGLCLAVCSCTILPLFAGIRQSGAGVGTAIVFLYTAPATNIIAVIFTSSLIGVDVALARIILSIGFAIIIGVSMAALFPDKISEDTTNVAAGQAL